MNHIMLVGIQGSGKGTQALKILEKYPDFVLFEMGAELRKFSKKDTVEAEEVRSYMDQGLKVPNKYIFLLTEEFIKSHPNQPVLMDGAIRSQEQQDAIGNLWGNFDIIFLDLDEVTAINRLSGRRIDPETNETFSSDFTGDTNPKTGNKLITRTDDTPEGIKSRISWSKLETLPLIGFWRNQGHAIYRIDASATSEEIFSQISSIIDKARSENMEA